MGNNEKLAVLVVLLTSAVVLAVSLNDGGEEGAVPDPFGSLDSGEVAAAAPGTSGDGLRTGEAGTGEPPSAGLVPRRGSTGPGAASTPTKRGLPLLDAGLTTQDPVSPAVTGLLTSRRGLRPSFVPEYMEYTVEQGDTWSGLALRFYSDARMVSSLRIANDDLAELRVGSEILVPVHDLSVEASSRDRFVPAPVVRTPEPARSTPSSARPSARPSREPARAASSTVRPTRYTVADGDNLSKISKKVFGTSTRWAEIYAANRATLKSPDWLTVGMELVIPADGEFAGVEPPVTESAAEAPKPAKKKVR